MTAIPIVFDDIRGLRRVGEPVTVGVPFPRGAVSDPTRLTLVDAREKPAPLQTSVLARWPDGSVKWGLLDFQVDVEPDHPGRYRVLIGERRPDAADVPPILVETVRDGVVVRTEAAQFVIDGPTLGIGVRDSARPGAVTDVATGAWSLTDGAGRSYTPRVDRTVVETSGPLRTTLRLEGAFVAASRPLCRFFGWMSFFANSAVTRLALTVRNPRRARHRGNFWDLGDPGSIQIRDLSLRLTLSERGDRVAAWSVEPGLALAVAENQDLELYQDSSGGPNWNSLNHVNRDHRVTTSFPGYRLRVGSDVRHGQRAEPLVGLFSARHGIGAAVQSFWQNFPKAVAVDGHSLVLRLFPPQSADAHELQGGEQKTHVIHLAPLAAASELETLSWVRTPLVAHATPDWYAASEAIPYLTPQGDDPNEGYLRLVSAAIDGSDSFEAKREISDEYGWRHFGDIYADHEAVHYRGRPPVISHYNNQYDAIHGAFVQFLRTGDARWFRMMDELARHVVDIDVYHTTEDRAAFNHGLFWHTNHYATAATATHRSYSRRVSPHGGGPANEHCYTTGLLHHYYLTGSAPSRDTVVEMADRIIDMDDGRKHVLGWVDTSPTGAASATTSPSYHGPGRGAGNAITTLLNGFTATGDRRFVDKAEDLVRRCIHPHDTIDALCLMDAERRWSYTVFLQVLGHYLDLKVQRHDLDTMYAYAQASLLHYARWMATHERPYLTRPEQLEFPTETWSAQDMRKSDVFKFAVKHAHGGERERFLERSDFFFSSSVDELTASPTRALTRPVVILMSCGYMQRYFQRRPDVTAPRGPGADFGAPQAFVPQRDRVKAKLQAAVAATLAASVVLGALVTAGAGH